MRYGQNMSAYADMTVKQLQDLLKSRGLSHKGRKADLVSRLDDYDVVINGQSNVDDDDIVLQTSQTDNDDDLYVASDDPVVQNSDNTESEAVRLLKLQIELAKLNLQQAQLSGSNADQLAIDRIDLGSVRSRLPVMSEHCDVISYFVTLEKSFVINSVPKAKWAMLLPSLLNGRASKVFAQLSIETCQNYDETKIALLNAFKCNADAYLRKLQSERRSGQESYFMYLARLKEYQTLYLMSREISDFDSLKDEMLSIYFMSSLSESVAEFVRTRQPRNSKECAEAADLFYAIKSRHNGQGLKGHKTPGKPNWSQQQSLQSDKLSELKSNDVVVANVKSVDKVQATGRDKSTRGCWTCGSPDHRMANCDKSKPANSNKKGQQPKSAQPTCLAHDDSMLANAKFMIPVYLGDSPKVRVGWRDTASSFSIIGAEHSDKCQLTDKTVTVVGISGQPQTLKVGLLALKSPHFGYSDTVLTEVAILDAPLPNNVDILLGNLLYSKFPIRDCFDVSPSIETFSSQTDRSTPSMDEVGVLRNAVPTMFIARDGDSLNTGSMNEQQGLAECNDSRVRVQAEPSQLSTKSTTSGEINSRSIFKDVGSNKSHRTQQDTLEPVVNGSLIRTSDSHESSVAYLTRVNRPAGDQQLAPTVSNQVLGQAIKPKQMTRDRRTEATMKRDETDGLNKNDRVRSVSDVGANKTVILDGSKLMNEQSSIDIAACREETTKGDSVDEEFHRLAEIDPSVVNIDFLQPVNE